MLTKSHVDWGSLLNKPKLLEYFEYLKTTCTIGPEGRLTKLERTCDALNYLKLAFYDDQQKILALNSLIDQISRWKCSLRKEKKLLNHKRLESISETDLNYDQVKRFIENVAMWQRFDRIVQNLSNNESDVDSKDLKFCTSALALSALFSSWQRPGAVQNLTLKQFENAVLIGDTRIVSVTEHKTGVGGAARLGFNPELYERITEYLSYVRPCMITMNEDIDYVFILPDGKKIVKLANLIRFMEAELKILIPSATVCQKNSVHCCSQKMYRR